LSPIIPAVRRDPFDDPAWLFDLKLDGFRGVADTIAGRVLSKRGSRLKRFESLLDQLPEGYVFDGEIVVLDDAGRPGVQRPAVRAPRSGLHPVRFDGRGRRPHGHRRRWDGI